MAETNYSTVSGLSTSQAERGPRVSEEVRAKGEAGWGELLRRPVRVLRRRLASSLFLSFLVTQDLGGSWALAQLDAVLVSTPSQIRFGHTLVRKAFSASEFNGRTARIIRLTGRGGTSSRGTAVIPVHPPLPTRPLQLPPFPGPAWLRLAACRLPQQARSRQLGGGRPLVAPLRGPWALARLLVWLGLRPKSHSPSRPP